MNNELQEVLEKAYASFNDRDIDAVLLNMQPEVHWPNGWEGGYVQGHDEVRAYWVRQWKQIHSIVKPVSYRQLGNGQIEVEVHQKAEDMDGNAIFDGMVKHLYTFENGKIKSMDIKQ